MGLVAAAGKRADELARFGVRVEELHRGGADPEFRRAFKESFDRPRPGAVFVGGSGARTWISWCPADPSLEDQHLPEVALSEASKKKILWDNCARLYNLAGA